MLDGGFHLSAPGSADQSTSFVLVLAIGAVTLIFVVMLVAAVVWSKHGLLPTEHWSAITVPEFVKKKMREANRSAGWGDGAGEDQGEQSIDPPSIEQTRSSGGNAPSH